MVRLLPICFLISIFCLFGIIWIIFSVDPASASWYVFALLSILIGLFVFLFVGYLFYFVRTKLHKRFSQNWYFYTSFKMAFFLGLFAFVASSLAILNLVSLINLILTIGAVSLFAIWSYLGRG